MGLFRSRFLIFLFWIAPVFGEDGGAVKPIAGFHVAYDKGIVFFSDDSLFSMKLDTRIQVLHEYFANENEPDTDGFLVRRLRLNFKGNFFSPGLQYRINLGMEGSKGGATAKILDGYIYWKQIDEFQPKMGQFKVPFTLEQLTSSSTLQLVDRSFLDGIFGLERDIGADIHSEFFENKVETHLFTMNGSGINMANENQAVIFGSRAWWHILGNHGYGMSDIDYSTSPHLSLGGAFVYDYANVELANAELLRSTIDIVMKYKGFSLHSEGHFVRNTTKEKSDWAGFGQVGYFVVPLNQEIALRAALLSDDGTFDDSLSDRREYTVGYNYFIFDHRAKIQIDYSILDNFDLAGGVDQRARSQIQLHF